MGLREFACNAEITFERVAVTHDQIRLLHLPTRPTKATDSRSRNFDGESVELDAIDPLTLRGMVRECIERHIDKGALERTKAMEAMERDSLIRWIDGSFLL